MCMFDNFFGYFCAVFFIKCYASFPKRMIYYEHLENANTDRRKEIHMRIWFKIWKDNHLLKDTVIENNENDTRTHKIFQALDQVCYEFDLGKPIWLDATIAEFKRHDKARFYQDNFVEEIDFDYLEIHVIEED